MTVRQILLSVGFMFNFMSSAIAQTTSLASVDSLGNQGNASSPSNVADYRSISLSSDGWYIAFTSLATNLVATDTNGCADVFVHDRSSGTTERVSVDSSGAEGNSSSHNPSISSDGRFISFDCVASNLIPSDTNGTADVFVHDRITGITERVSVDSSGGEGNKESWLPAISADGCIVAFDSLASTLVMNDTNSQSDVFVHDRTSGGTERVSVSSTGAQANRDSIFGVSLSGDGQIVAFASLASNLVTGDGNNAADIFVHDRSTGVTSRVSVDSNGTEANADSYYPSISTDGRFIAFTSGASNLVTGDTNGLWDVFVHDLATGSTERVNVDSSGGQAQGTYGSGLYYSTISSDGEFVAFDSDASNLVSNDTNNYVDVFVHDRTTGVTEIVSVDSYGAEGNQGSYWQSISADGHVVAFGSPSTNLVASDANGYWDVFAHERSTIDASWANYGIGLAGTYGIPSFTAQSDPILGTTLTLDLGNSFGSSTSALLFLGFQRAQIHSSWGGELLVLPFSVMLLGMPPSGLSFSGSIPNDPTLNGFMIDLQTLEADPVAPKGVSFTEGLELILGG